MKAKIKGGQKWKVWMYRWTLEAKFQLDASSDLILINEEIWLTNSIKDGKKLARALQELYLNLQVNIMQNITFMERDFKI